MFYFVKHRKVLLDDLTSLFCLISGDFGLFNIHMRVTLLRGRGKSKLLPIITIPLHTHIFHLVKHRKLILDDLTPLFCLTSGDFGL